MKVEWSLIYAGLFHAEFSLLCRLHDPRREKLGEDPRSKAVHASFSARKTRCGKLADVATCWDLRIDMKFGYRPSAFERQSSRQNVCIYCIILYVLNVVCIAICDLASLTQFTYHTTRVVVIQTWKHWFKTSSFTTALGTGFTAPSLDDRDEVGGKQKRGWRRLYDVVL